ncbi:serine--tRNA ligase [Paenibacillus thalictri]|uniref:Serine--tRNA ligase n=1 Tax=Paenibacillus thalictri TaxID=2527873 RepID=A0A4Q9DNV5_9BACL|nr:serine--tRNA ligase [Paenibacillus thalictri]TBL75282.1 serine--tRNA ligase [Paenibacillus thalictri]
MLDVKWILDNQETVQTAANQKGIAVSVAELAAAQQKKLELLREVELLRQERNTLSQRVAALVREERAQTAERWQTAHKEERPDHEPPEGSDSVAQTPALSDVLKDNVKQINNRLTLLETELSETQHTVDRLLLRMPNIVSPDSPVGRSDADNVEVRKVGAPREFDFAYRDHVSLGELHQMIDIPRGVKTGGTRSYFLRGAGVLLHRAVQQLAVDLLVEAGFTLLEVPLMVTSDVMTNAGFFPLGEDQTYKLEGENKWLVGTSEASLVSYFGGEMLDLSQPVKLAAASTCFRSEVGSSGRDVQGLYRVHQFAKVEQVVLCQADPELAERLLQEITSNAEQLLQLLELPYRVMAVCTGDMSQKTYKQYDIETWMPSRNAYGETHSSSSLLDFQARRAMLRYRGEDGRPVYCYTLNNTAVASPRILIPLLENHQEEDGAIHIPPALRPYMNGAERLVPQGARSRPLR